MYSTLNLSNLESLIGPVSLLYTLGSDLSNLKVDVLSLVDRRENLLKGLGRGSTVKGSLENGKKTRLEYYREWWETVLVTIQEEGTL